MLRIAKVNEDYTLDLQNKKGGRGAYVCKSNDCIALTIKKKLLNRAFKTNLNSNIYELLGEYEQNN